MRKALFLIFCLCIIFEFSFLCFAKEGKEPNCLYNHSKTSLNVENISLNNDTLYPTGDWLKSPYELFQWWEKYGYPDYVCGVWSTNGGFEELTIGITDSFDENGNKGKDVILANIDDDNKVTFVYQKYSKNYLLSIMEEMNYHFQNNAEKIGLSCMGLYDDKNYIKIGIKKEKQYDPQTQKFVEEILLQYGDAISIEYSDELVYTYSGIYNNENTDISKNEKIYILSIIFLFLGSVLSSYVISKKRYNAALANGETETVYKYSKGEVKEKVKNSFLSPDESLKKKINDIISKY